MSVRPFVEQEPYEQGFARVFESEIMPSLGELEQERLARRKSFYRRLAGSIAAVAGAVILAYGLFPTVFVVPFLVLIIGAVIAAIMVQRPVKAFGDRLRALVMPPVCRFFGDLDYEANASTGRLGLDRFRRAHIIGSYTSARIDDLFAGRHRGTGFVMAEVTVKRRQRTGKNRSNRTVFRGLLFEVDVPAGFAGRVLLGRDAGGIGNALGGWFLGYFSGLNRVNFPHERFESLYEVYADDPEEAQRLITPDFADTMVALAEAYKGSPLKAAFFEGAFLLALPMRRNLFKAGSIFRPLDDCAEDLRRVLRDITIAHRLIDYLHGERPGALA
ncbi:MAG: DUF3137 domain-containing protein [Alphaproteobacteria bacterium]|jgi:hypothetical protein|nr:DUF3137 domain-containing protein [Alphaproteobacteria bacterium]